MVLALARLSAADREAVARGAVVSVAPAVYDKAWVDLDERQGRALTPTTAVAPVTRPTATRTATSRPATGPVAPTLASTAPAFSTLPSSAAVVTPAGAGGGVGIAWIAALVAGAGALAVAFWLAVRGRRRRRARAHHRNGSDEARVDDLFEAGRRLSGTLDPDEVVRRTVDEAVTLAAAGCGAYVARGAHGLRVAHTSRAGFPDDGVLRRGVVARAVDTAQPGRTPATGAGSDAVLAVPVVHEGHVVGVVVVARPGAPFGPTDTEALTRLAPFVASALAAADRHRDVAEQVLVDALTAVGNRRRLQQDLPGLVAAPGGVAMAMVDVDHFKRYNDAHGHQAGDVALQLVAQTMQANVRHGDVVYRYGGEEFAVLLPGADDHEAAEVAERLRLAVRQAGAACAHDPPCGPLTVSVGLATRGTDPDTLTARADAALYRAKHGGRDRVVVAPAEPSR